MVRVGRTKSWKRGKESYKGEMEIAFLVVLNFCVHVTGPPRCGHIEDERGPYQTQLECKERIHQMFNYMNANLPPGSVVAHGVCVKVEGEKL